MLKKTDTYQALVRGFHWDLPDTLNMAAQACDDWATSDPDRVAVIDLSNGVRVDTSFGALRGMADGLAHYLVDLGVQAGDRVGVLRSQSPWTLAAHFAIWKLGAISIPLFKLFGPDALLSRLNDSGARLVIGDGEDHLGLTQWLGNGRQAIVPEDLPLETKPFETAKTTPDTPAILIYTSGTTGAAKGALHGHRVLTGHLPGVEMSHDFLGQPDDCMWTPADWAWIGGLFNVALSALANGVPVVAARMAKFTPETCADIIKRGHVRNVFFPPTALRMLKSADAKISGLRSVGSGGEPLGAEMLAWGRDALGLTINEFYGQTECNMVASSCDVLFNGKPGCIGKPAPGFDIAVLDAQGNPTDNEGDIAVKRGCASMMLEYWNRPQQTAEKFIGDWLLTGDRGIWDGAFLRFVGREDDVITSSGYRIGPAEIEDCLMQHDAVATVGVVGKPDALRTEIVKAYVVLKDGITGSDDLAKDLQNFVKKQLAGYSYPREIGFLGALPMTVTGKVIRKELKARATRENEDR